MPSWHRATLVARASYAPHRLTLTLSVPPALAAAHQRPGQYHRLSLPQGEAHFAIASAPGAEAFDYVMRTDSAPASSAEGLVVGDALQVSAPEGPGFPLEVASGKPLLLVATGTAIGPMRSVINALSAQPTPPSSVTLLWGVRSEADLAYRAEHPAWERAGVRLHPVISHHHGRVQSQLEPLLQPEAVVFVCGQADLETELRARLGPLGHSVFLNH